jgi:hypothetical protein
MIGIKAKIPKQIKAIRISKFKKVEREKGSFDSKMLLRPLPAKVAIIVPGAIPTTVVQKKVRKETLKKAGAILTIQKGKKGIKRKKGGSLLHFR